MIYSTVQVPVLLTPPFGMCYNQIESSLFRMTTQYTHYIFQAVIR